MDRWPVYRGLQRRDSQRKTWFPHVAGESWSIPQSQSKREDSFFEINTYHKWRIKKNILLCESLGRTELLDVDYHAV